MFSTKSAHGMGLFFATAALAMSWTRLGAAAPMAPFQIEVVDAATKRGVPLVELEATNARVFVTDSAGRIALDDQDLMGQDVYFHVRSHGYAFPADGFGFRGKTMKVTPGGRIQLELQRINIAERLYRVTGGGIYHDTVVLGGQPPIRDPLLSGGVVGCDSVMTALHRGRIHWFWGDTNRLSYPLGNFHMTGAISRLTSDGGLDPARGVDFDYFVDESGFARPMAKMSGDGPTWISGLTVLRDMTGHERLYAHFVKIRSPLEAYAWGSVVWNDAEARFDQAAKFAEKHPMFPSSQAHSFIEAERDGTDYVYFATPFPFTRVRATPAAFLDLDQYEGFSCLEVGSTLEERKLDRDGDGRLRYGWKRCTPPLPQSEQQAWVNEGLISPGQARIALRDIETGKEVTAQSGSVYWNNFRQRWILIAVQLFGESSVLGEVWFAEADQPTGPWVYARKIVTHDKYSFYNPKQHPLFDQDGGRTVYFEGTYTHTFSGNPRRTPRYDYNQIMYRLDLADARLNLPVAVYRATNGPDVKSLQVNKPTDDVAFYALERPQRGTIPIYQLADSAGNRLTESQPSPGAEPVFYALPASIDAPPTNIVPLYEFTHEESQRRAFRIGKDGTASGYVRSAAPICLVWDIPRSAVDPAHE